MRTTSRIALAAALAVISSRTLADEGSTCSICGDPTFPAIDHPAPALVMPADGGETAAALQTDPTWPGTEYASPAVRLEIQPGDRPELDPLNPTAPVERYAATLGAPATHVAKR